MGEQGTCASRNNTACSQEVHGRFFETNWPFLQVIKQVLKLKCSATFAVPVTDEAVPNYLNVIKEPRDLGSISEKLGMSGEEGYTSLGKLRFYLACL